MVSNFAFYIQSKTQSLQKVKVINDLNFFIPNAALAMHLNKVKSYFKYSLDNV